MPHRPRPATAYRRRKRRTQRRRAARTSTPSGSQPHITSTAWSTAPDSDVRCDGPDRQAGGQFGVDAVHRRLIGLHPAGESDRLVRQATTSIAARRRRAGRAARPGRSSPAHAARADRAWRRDASGLDCSTAAMSDSVCGSPAPARLPRRSAPVVRCHSRSEALQSGQVGQRASGSVSANTSARRWASVRMIAIRSITQGCQCRTARLTSGT